MALQFARSGVQTFSRISVPLQISDALHVPHSSALPQPSDILPQFAPTSSQLPAALQCSPHELTALKTTHKRTSPNAER